MAFYNVMERIRKTAGLPAMKGGVPDKDHRKCSDWAAYTDAVDTVTGELVAELVACKENYAKLAGVSAAQAGKLADLHEKLGMSDLKRIKSDLSAKAMALELTPSQREAIEETVLN